MIGHDHKYPGAGSGVRAGADPEGRSRGGLPVGAAGGDGADRRRPVPAPQVSSGPGLIPGHHQTTP